MSWTQEEAIAFCREVEERLGDEGHPLHVGLTGGCLYKGGPRKDVDVIFYLHAGTDESQVNHTKVFDDLCRIGLEMEKVPDKRRVKATYHGKAVDCLFFYMDGGDYLGLNPL